MTRLIPALALLHASASHAETLQEALTAAYRTNPTLAAAQAGQRATDETVPIARANGLPSVDITGGFTENVKSASNSFTSPDRLISGRLSLAVPLYTGGAVRNATKTAQLRVKAGQDNLRAVESDVFTATVYAYMGVLRDQAIVSLNQGQVKVL